MKTLRQIEKFLKDESGPTAVEYAIMLALILAVVIASIGLVGNEANDLFEHSADSMDGNWVPPSS